MNGEEKEGWRYCWWRWGLQWSNRACWGQWDQHCDRRYGMALDLIGDDSPVASLVRMMTNMPRTKKLPLLSMGLPWWFNGKESACNAGDLGLMPGLGRSLEKGMATHSSILAWRIPWTAEPGGLQSMGSQRVGHDWVTNTDINEALKRCCDTCCSHHVFLSFSTQILSWFSFCRCGEWGLERWSHFAEDKWLTSGI